MFGIYIHVPFCRKVCDYCDFRVIPSNGRLFQEYSDLLCREIELFDRRNPGVLKNAETLYLGGGTPSLLPQDVLSQIFECLRSVGVEMSSLREISMEFNPESTTESSVEHALSLGVNRISLGLQTFDSQLLARIGRSHSAETGGRALRLLVEYPQIQTSGDLMFCLPGQTIQSFLDDVDRLSDYPLSHISFYGLTVNPRTVLGQKVRKGAFLVDENLYEPMYTGGVRILEHKGFNRYEVSNFAKLGFESVHNRNYWNRGEYAGFGPGAHSFRENKRFYAPEIYPRWREYLRADAPVNCLTVDELNRDDVLMEVLWLSLRQSSGLDFSVLENLGFDLPEKKYGKWLDKGYLELNRDSAGGQRRSFLRLQGRGWVFMDDIVTDLAK